MVVFGIALLDFKSRLPLDKKRKENEHNMNVHLLGLLER